MRILPRLLGLLAFAAVPAWAQLAPVNSPTGPVMAGPYLVVDAGTGETLLERNAGSFWYPASLTKLMTMYVAFEELKANRMFMGEALQFSDFARSREPSKLGLAPGRTITVEQGLQALVARSANDVSTAFAERISGSEPQFAIRMTETASRLGMLATQFRNAHGLPDKAQITTARDMAILGMQLSRQFPEYYPLFLTKEFMLGNQRIGPGLKFLDTYAPYAEGLKTGFICASGFNIVASAMRDGRRLIGVAFGFRRADLRDEFMVRLFDEAFAMKTGGARPRVWQLANSGGAPGHVLGPGECGHIRYDMPGDAIWLGTYGDWRTAKHQFDNAQGKMVTLGLTNLGKEYILPVTNNKVTRQAAIIADVEPEAAARLCADYTARKLFCEVRKPQDFVAPFAAFWR
ncbi:MAG TPA: D-alanyl-D-alanine carboxypeptidase family protein [Reyranellaceae bacterium]|nr:D-alanyl-D-alanine carboxypeptidase family protein [Reyranellaceae bacterium]